MSDNDPAPAAPETPSDELQDQLPEEWKPEPREWTWKDLFTAPMLAFKPKCMLISFITVVVVAAFGYGWMQLTAQTDHIALVGPVVCWLGLFIGAVLFSLGASLVSVFYKADLLDDEFLSFGEACKQYFPRLKAVLLVPLTLVGILAGMNAFLWLCQVIGSIPFLGPVLYGVLYPLGWLLALLIVLLGIAVALAVFVGPAVLAVRKHGWFDNVIDVFEAVGTKPHQLAGSLLLTGLMIAICYCVPTAAMYLLKANTISDSVPGYELAKTEAASESWQNWAFPFLGALEAAAREDLGPEPIDMRQRVKGFYNAEIAELREELGAIASEEASTDESVEARNERRKAKQDQIAALEAQRDDNPSGGWNTWLGGVPLAFWQLVIFFGIVGYCLNVFLAGGMLTYLAVREDDYWDDEDLEDLDKLAKELEEEAKREAEQAGAAETPGATNEAEAKTDDGDKPADNGAKTDDDKPAKADDDKKADNEAKDDDKKADNESEPKAEDGDKPTDDGTSPETGDKQTDQSTTEAEAKDDAEPADDAAKDAEDTTDDAKDDADQPKDEAGSDEQKESQSEEAKASDSDAEQQDEDESAKPADDDDKKDEDEKDDDKK